MATVEVKCVICGHRQEIPLTDQEPMCSQCMGPVVVERVEYHAGPVRNAQGKETKP